MALRTIVLTVQYTLVNGEALTPEVMQRLIDRADAGALRWGQDRERHLLRHGLNKTRKEVPTLEAFGPRFIDDYAVANRQKPSEIAAKRTIVHGHLKAALGGKRLDAITTDDVQKLKHRLRNRAPEDREQRAHGPERAAEEGGGVGRDRSRPLHDAAGAGAEAVDGLLRLRGVRTAGHGRSTKWLVANA
jgi:hypothetical protein